MDVAKAVDELLKNSKDPRATEWLSVFSEGTPRGVVKRSVMTQPYGLSKHSNTSYVHDFMLDEYPVLMRGDWKYTGFKNCAWLGGLVWKAIKAAIPKAREFMDWLQDAMKVCATHGVMPTWETPLGFKVANHYGKRETKRIDTAFKDRVIKIRDYSYNNEPSMGKLKASVVANWVHSIDASIMLRTTTKCKALGISSLAMSHDSFGCPAHQADALYHTTREAAYEILSEDLVGNLKADLEFQLPPGVTLGDPPSPGDFDLKGLKESTYFFI